MTGDNKVFIGPVDPSARQWLPGGFLGAGILAGQAMQMAADIDRSFIMTNSKR